MTPQRLHAELLATGPRFLDAYLQGALKDATHSVLHGTHRYGQSERDKNWLVLLQSILDLRGHRSWIYREGRARPFWVLETSAKFLSMHFDASTLVGKRDGLYYVRGYFDADGGLPCDVRARLYVQFGQNDRGSLETLAKILASWKVSVGKIHNPSRSVDPDYWRFFVRADSRERFMRLVGSWHPRKRVQMNSRMKI